MLTRGEFKTPGGKLIAVEFEVVDGTLRNVVVTGDFFLCPDEAFPLLAAVLEGAPATLDASGYAAMLAPVLAGDVELLGASAQGLATAVTRALRAENSD